MDDTKAPFDRYPESPYQLFCPWTRQQDEEVSIWYKVLGAVYVTLMSLGVLLIVVGATQSEEANKWIIAGIASFCSGGILAIALGCKGMMHQGRQQGKIEEEAKENSTGFAAQLITLDLDGKMYTTRFTMSEGKVKYFFAENSGDSRQIREISHV